MRVCLCVWLCASVSVLDVMVLVLLHDISADIRSDISPLRVAEHDISADIRSDISPLRVAEHDISTDIRSDISPLGVAEHDISADIRSDISPLRVAEHDMRTSVASRSPPGATTDERKPFRKLEIYRHVTLFMSTTGRTPTNSIGYIIK